jgi:hypothetical protein
MPVDFDGHLKGHAIARSFTERGGGCGDFDEEVRGPTAQFRFAGWQDRHCVLPSPIEVACEAGLADFGGHFHFGILLGDFGEGCCEAIEAVLRRCQFGCDIGMVRRGAAGLADPSLDGFEGPSDGTRCADPELAAELQEKRIRVLSQQQPCIAGGC